MIEGFEIKCEKCGNTAVDIEGTVVNYNQVKVKFKCLVSGCGYESEVPITQTSFIDFEKKPKEKAITLGTILRDALIKI